MHVDFTIGTKNSARSTFLLHCLFETASSVRLRFFQAQGHVYEYLRF